MPKLDRLVQFDEQSRNFPIRTLVDGKTPRSYTWYINTSLDQGNEGACVGFGWSAELAAKPYPHPVTNETAFALYHQAQSLDGWPLPHEGSSVLAGAKAVQANGFMTEYRWAFGEPDLCLAVGYKGPAVLGVNWYTGMDAQTTDSKGRRWAHVTGSVRGGHCFLTHGYSVPLNAYKCWNSWGPPSEFYISKDDMAKLLADQGEACIPVVRK